MKSKKDTIKNNYSALLAMPLIGQSGLANNEIFTQIIQPLINFLSAAVGVILVLSLVWAGVQYITSSGDPSGIKDARDRIVAVVWSFIIYIFAFAILQYLLPGGLL